MLCLSFLQREHRIMHHIISAPFQFIHAAVFFFHFCTFCGVHCEVVNASAVAPQHYSVGSVTVTWWLMCVTTLSFIGFSLSMFQCITFFFSFEYPNLSDPFFPQLNVQYVSRFLVCSSLFYVA